MFQLVMPSCLTSRPGIKNPLADVGACRPGGVGHARGETPPPSSRLAWIALHPDLLRERGLLHRVPGMSGYQASHATLATLGELLASLSCLT
jgi:hypothetical protein